MKKRSPVLSTLGAGSWAAVCSGAVFLGPSLRHGCCFIQIT